MPYKTATGTPAWATRMCLPSPFDIDDYNRVRLEWEAVFRKLKGNHLRKNGRPITKHTHRAKWERFYYAYGHL